MADSNTQTDHRTLSRAAIKERMLQTEKGDEVLFNSKEKPLTVVEPAEDVKEWEVYFEADDENEIVELYTARTRDDLVFEVGDEIDAWEPTYKVAEIEKLTSSSAKDPIDHTLCLKGPQGGEYVLWHSDRGVLFRCTSADRQLWNGFKVDWFKNLTQEGQ
ncbi:hypothetical protein [Natronoarchaeum rubrum]|uniref:hypothetical protein n=1 Tax=Natronoarchaeum rubrum TaxID=755311 RepID=UPI00211188ED|nr:hypothetical protein [Natronoarchaeum rubrum]